MSEIHVGATVRYQPDSGQSKLFTVISLSSKKGSNFIILESGAGFLVVAERKRCLIVYKIDDAVAKVAKDAWGIDDLEKKEVHEINGAYLKDGLERAYLAGRNYLGER